MCVIDFFKNYFNFPYKLLTGSPRKYYPGRIIIFIFRSNFLGHPSGRLCATRLFFENFGVLFLHNQDRDIDSRKNRLIQPLESMSRSSKIASKNQNYYSSWVLFTGPSGI